MNADPENPGYRNIIFRPQPAGDMTFASYSNLTPYGTAGIRWEKNGHEFIMEVTVPVGSSATVYVPVNTSKTIRESGKVIKSNNRNISHLKTDNNYSVFKVISGNYKFSAEL
jgi:alpha-L-rhamnosidase